MDLTCDHSPPSFCPLVASEGRVGVSEGNDDDDCDDDGDDDVAAGPLSLGVACAVAVAITALVEVL